MMSEATSTDQLLNRVPYYIKEGLVDEAARILENIQAETPQQEKELAYLKAWNNAAQGRWDEAAQTILFTDLFEDVLTEKVEDIHELGQTERRRRAHYVLMMGTVALNLGRYDEAANHYLQCLKFLNERRMNDPRLRIKALFSLGCAYTQSGLYAAALSQFQAALDLCGDDPEHPERASIYHNLSVTYTSQHQYEQALHYGEKALQLYVDNKERNLEGNVRNLLGNILYKQSKYDEARRYFIKSQTMAANDGNRLMLLINTVALAEANYAEGDLKEAQSYCDEAQNVLETHQEFFNSSRYNQFKGQAYLICGQVAQARAEKAQKQEADDLLSQAERWYNRAIDILQQSKGDLAQAYKLLAQLLERSSREDQALSLWRQAYTLSSQLDQV